MTCRALLPQLLLLAFTPGLFAQDPAQLATPAPLLSGGTADIALQGYYLGGISQPLSALSGMNLSFREFVPRLGLLTGNIEGYADSTRGRIGQNSATLHGLKWMGRRWTITGGDFGFHTGLVPLPFTNYSYPELGARGVKVEMTDGPRQFTLFAGEETLQEGPRMTFRLRAQQFATGASVTQHLGSRVMLGVRYLGLSSSQEQLAANPAVFPAGSAFLRADSLALQSLWFVGRGLTFYADTGLTRTESPVGMAFDHSLPFSWLTGAKWKTKRLTVTANYGSLSRSALPVAGNYFGDRQGAFADMRYKLLGSVEVFASAARSQNNLEKNPAIVNFVTDSASAGVNATLPGKVVFSGQYSKIGLTGELASDPTQNQSQRNSQYQVSLTKSLARHSLSLTARDLNLAGMSYAQKQKSAELQDDMNFWIFGVGGAVRMQQQTGGGLLQNSMFVKGSGRVRLGSVSLYGQFEVGNDLVNKTLFATNSVKTSVIGAEIPLNRLLAHGWTLRAEAFRTTLLSTLNPASILALQSQGSDVTQVLNDFNQWSFYVRLNHRAHWGTPPPETEEANNQVVYGAIEGFVYDDATGSHGAAEVSVQLDKTRTATTDATGRYRFENVPEGVHAVTLNIAELEADYSPGPPPPASSRVKPRATERVDLRVVKTGSFVRGSVRGLAEDDKGIVRLEAIIVNLVPVDGGDGSSYTTCDGDGEFGFYNLKAGRYRVSVDRSSLPEDYVVVTAGEIEVDPGANGGALLFRMEKHVKELPVRKVLEISE